MWLVAACSRAALRLHEVRSTRQRQLSRITETLNKKTSRRNTPWRSPVATMRSIEPGEIGSNSRFAAEAMPLKSTSRRDSKLQVRRVGTNWRQLVIDETGAADPSPAFVEEYLTGLAIDDTGIDNPSPTFLLNYLAGLQGQDHARGSPVPATVVGDGSAADAKLGLEIDIAAAQPEHTLESLAGLDPNDSFAQHIVGQIMRIENASPTMIHNIMRDAGIPNARPDAPSSDSRCCGIKFYIKDYSYICQCEVDNTDIALCAHTEGEVIVLEHEPGVNDLVSGTLQKHAQDRSSLSPIVVVPVSPQDAVACKANWDSLAEYQPNGLLSLQMLKDEGLFSEALLDKLPSRYHTTVTGLKRVFEEIEEEMDEDVILNAFFVRGGETPVPKTVVYAEELLPYVAEGEPGYDEEFWEGIEELRKGNEKSGIVDLLKWAHAEDGGSKKSTSVEVGE